MLGELLHYTVQVSNNNAITNRMRLYSLLLSFNGNTDGFRIFLFFAEISTGSTVFCFCFWGLKHFLIGIHEPVGVLALVPWNPDFSDHLGSGNWFEIIFLSRKRKVASNSGEVRTIEDSKNQESTIFLHCD